MTTWSGTYTNELVVASPYQAKNGVTGVIDTAVTGDVVIDAPSSPEQDSSFSVWWTNQNRSLLTLQSPDGIRIPRTGGIVPAVTTELKNGVASFTFVGSNWNLVRLNPFVVPIGLAVSAIWEPRNTNGLCTLVDQRHAVSVERTALGVYLMTTDGADITGRIIMPALNTIGHAANMHPTFTLQDRTSTTVELLTGLRNPGGVFNTDDLDQDASNVMSLVVASIP